MATKKTAGKRALSRTKPATPPPGGVGYGGYITLDGKRIPLVRHETDFQVLGESAMPMVTEALRATSEADRVARRVGPAAVRMHVPPASRDESMEEIRKDAVAAHIYRNAETGEELAFSKHVLVKLRAGEDDELLGEILATHNLSYKGRQGGEYVLEVSRAATENPLKIANRIAEMGGVEYAQPEQIVSLQMHAAPPALLSRQWYLSAIAGSDPDVRPEAGVDAQGAWAITKGSPEVVVAVIDDGFQLDHPCFAGTAIHRDARDFAGSDSNPSPAEYDYHGTPVASIAVGSSQGGAMSGLAPGCTFLPIRIGFGGNQPFSILDVFRYVSERADVVNCSFGTGPATTPVFSPGFRDEIAQLAASGGRRGKGLVMVFSAANDDVPTSCGAAANVNGFRFTGRGVFGQTVGRLIAPGQPVFTGYPMIPGVIVVGACSSLLRKSGYSNWGRQITVVAPSNNTHYNMAFLPVTDPLRAPFVANYRGRGQVAASNRPPGRRFSPLPDDPSTLTVNENDYTDRFGGTSGAAPVVAGIAALMLSVNPELTSAQVRTILMATADRDLDTALDLSDDPNILPNLSGHPLGFVNGRSILFGSGKANAARAVTQAAALAPPPAPAAEPPALGVMVNRLGTAASPSFCRIHGVFAGQMMVSGLSKSVSQVCANSSVAIVPEDPNRTPVGFCGNETIWQVSV